TGARKRLSSRSDGSPVEVEALEKALAALEDERPVRDAGLGEEHRQWLRGLSLLTLKPWVVVANLAEGAGVHEGLPERTLGLWAAARCQGRLRVDGKDYLVGEGDVLHVRFAV